MQVPPSREVGEHILRLYRIEAGLFDRSKVPPWERTEAEWEHIRAMEKADVINASRKAFDAAMNRFLATLPPSIGEPLLARSWRWPNIDELA